MGGVKSSGADQVHTELMPFYGRKKGRNLSPLRLKLIEELLPKVSFGGVSKISHASLFPQAKKVFLEIGFGSGEHMLSMARTNPDAGFLGVDPFLNGIGKVLFAIHKENITNILLSTEEGEEILPQLTSNSIDSCFILFPDPWNKRAHFKRRFINEKSSRELYRILKPGGGLSIATDHQGYSDHIKQILGESDLELTVHSKRHLTTDFTRYEKKAISQGAKVSYFEAKKVAKPDVLG